MITPERIDGYRGGFERIPVENAAAAASLFEEFSGYIRNTIAELYDITISRIPSVVIIDNPQGDIWDRYAVIREVEQGSLVQLRISSNMLDKQAQDLLTSSREEPQEQLTPVQAYGFTLVRMLSHACGKGCSDYDSLVEIYKQSVARWDIDHK